MTVNIKVSDCTTGYGYFQIHQSRGLFHVYQCTVHWARGWSYAQTIGTARNQVQALDMIKSFAGGSRIRYR